MKTSINTYALTALISLIFGATTAVAGQSVDQVIYSDENESIVALGDGQFESKVGPHMQSFDADIYSDQSQDIVLLGGGQLESGEFAAFTVARNDAASTSPWDQVIYADEARETVNLD